MSLSSQSRTSTCRNCFTTLLKVSFPPHNVEQRTHTEALALCKFGSSRMLSLSQLMSTSCPTKFKAVPKSAYIPCSFWPKTQPLVVKPTLILHLVFNESAKGEKEKVVWPEYWLEKEKWCLVARVVLFVQLVSYKIVIGSKNRRGKVKFVIEDKAGVLNRLVPTTFI